MTEKFRSFTITKGVTRSPNRSMLRAIGYGDADFDKPIVGIANGHSTMNPCNAGIQPLVDKVFAFGDTPSAKGYMESDAHAGKVVVHI